jgi:hypothetical protein
MFQGGGNSALAGLGKNAQKCTKNGGKSAHKKKGKKSIKIKRNVQKMRKDVQICKNGKNAQKCAVHYSPPLNVRTLWTVHGSPTNKHLEAVVRVG